MKKLIKFIFEVILFFYLVLAVFAIACLVKRNSYGMPQFGNHTLIAIDGDNDYFKNGDLVIIEKPANKDVKLNDVVFFYKVQFRENTVNVGTIVSKEVVNENETTFSVNGTSFSSEHLIGKIDGSSKIAKIGSVLKVLTSRWGFLFLIILPLFILFMWELLAIYLEVKKARKSSEE